MRNKFIYAGVGLVLLAAPLISSASTLSDLQVQLQSLLSQIQAQSSVSASTSAAWAAPSYICPNIQRSLSIGSTGSDVTALQQFLNSKGYLSVSATGYFGALTKAAVAHWQSDNSIAASSNAGYGMFGPLSRSFFVNWCNGNTGITQASLSVNPSSGNAPLITTFSTNLSIADTATYTVDFNDGTSGSLTKANCIAITSVVGGQGGIRCNYTVTHTYATNGTYVAKLLKNTCHAGTECFAGPQTVATATVTIGSSTVTGQQFSANPSTGSAPLTVQFTATAPQGQTLGNTVNFGDGTSGTLGVVPTCSGCNEMGAVSHTYASSGTYTATLMGGNCVCPANGICNCPNIPILGTVTVTVSSSSTANIQQLNAPGSVTLAPGAIAEVRNMSYYFTLESLTNSTATIQVTPVGCWNWFPSDTPPQIRCMIATVLIPPQTLTIGQPYYSGNYSITLTGISNNSANFYLNASSTAQ